METYEKKYKELEGKIKKAYLYAQTDSTKAVLEDILPELVESEDEKIRKELIEHIKANKWADYVLFQKFLPDDVIAWLEKQESVEEIVARCKNSWYNEGKIQGMKEGLTDDEKYQQGWHDAHEKQVSVDKDKTVKGVRRGVATSLIKYIDANSNGMCLSNMECEDIEDAIVNGKWYKVYNYMKKKLEKRVEKPQGKSAIEAINEKIDNANKVERKFKVGDIVQYITDSTDRRKIKVIDTLCNMYHTDSSPIMFEVEDEWKVVVNAEDVEPKFKIGDWVVVNNDHESVYQIEEINNFRYILRHILGDSMLLSFSSEDMIRHWTITDAKPGDILSNGNMIVIFKEFEEPAYREHIVAYIGLDTIGAIQVTNGTWQLGDKVNPASKEQRDLLFQKMKKAGYEWDAEKKELKLLITNGGDFESENCEQKPAWGEDDELNLKGIIDELEANKSEAPEYDYDTYDRFIDWLESIKNRVGCEANCTAMWKPSDKQMNALDSTLQYSQVSHNSYEYLNSLYNYLKKLMKGGEE